MIENPLILLAWIG